jgi:hypothetical protein
LLEFISDATADCLGVSESELGLEKKRLYRPDTGVLYKRKINIDVIIMLNNTTAKVTF